MKILCCMGGGYKEKKMLHKNINYDDKKIIAYY